MKNIKSLRSYYSFFWLLWGVEGGILCKLYVSKIKWLLRHASNTSSQLQNGPRKNPAAQSGAVHTLCFSWTHSKINLSSDPWLALFQCRLHISYPEEMSCLHVMLQEDPSNTATTAHSRCFFLFSFHFYSFLGHYKTYSFSFSSWTTVNVMKSLIRYEALFQKPPAKNCALQTPSVFI